MEDREEQDKDKLDRIDYGRCFMHCCNCGVKLYEFDGKKDSCKPCPDPKECSEQTIKHGYR